MVTDDLEYQAGKLADKFLLRAIQSWGQTMEERKAVRIEYMEFAGFTDPESDDAKEWITKVEDTMPWGRFQDEAAHLKAALLNARKGE